MLTKNTSVSVVLATFNCDKYIEETISSILGQSFSDFELLITDDCSTDNTYQILNKYKEKDDRIKVFRNSQNSGAAVSRNNSISMAQGRFIAFIDSDDLWLPDKLNKQIHFMQQGHYALSFTSYEIIDKESNLTGRFVDVQIPDSIDYHDLLAKKATFGCSSVMVDKEQIGDFSMPLIRTGQDYATWLSLLKVTKSAYLLRQPLTRYRITPGSISRNKFKKAKRQWQIYRDIESLGVFKSFYYFCNYAYRAVVRR